MCATSRCQHWPLPARLSMLLQICVVQTCQLHQYALRQDLVTETLQSRYMAQLA